MPSALDVVTSGLATHDVVVILFYRGAWCAICKAWLNKYTNIPAYGELRGIARVLSVAISSEAEADAGAAQASFGLDGVEDLVFVNDSENEVAKLLNDKLSAKVFIDKNGAGPLTHFVKYDNGFTQSAAVAIKVDNDGEWTKLYSWSSVPSVLNMRGALGRRTPAATVSGILDALKETKEL